MFENPNAPAGKREPRLADGVSDDLVRHYREGNRDKDKFEKPLANSFARAIPYSRSSLSEPLFGTQTVIVINS
jgi:hypothetical protein